MKRSLYPILLSLLALFLVACASDAPSDRTTADGDGEPLVNVGDRTITTEEFQAEIDRIPPFQRRELETPAGKQKFLDRMVDMELLYLAAIEEKLDEDPAMIEEFERAQRQILMRHYYKDRIQNAAQPEDEVIEKYYQEHLDEFSVKERVRARWILAEDQAGAKSLADRVKGGEDFAALARTESKDAPTAAEDGDLGWFTSDGYVRSVGVDADFTAKVFALDLGKISAPFEVATKGWAIVRLDEREAAHGKELAEVRGEIARRLTPKVQEEYYAKRMKELREQFGVEQLGESFDSASSPEELFQMAQDAKDPRERIGYYEQMVERYPDFVQADRAAFMIGFVKSEELGEKQEAKAAFERFMTLYPESDLVEDARYMLDALEGKEPPFEVD